MSDDTQTSQLVIPAKAGIQSKAASTAEIFLALDSRLRGNDKWQRKCSYFHRTIIGFLLSASIAHAAAWNVDATNSTITFAGTQAGDAFHGSFKKFTPVIEFDPAHPERGKISVMVDITSATIDDKDKQAALPTDDWFAARQFPTAQFQSTAIRATTPHRYEAMGDLTLRGIRKPITLAFQLTPHGTASKADGSVTLNRGDFGIGQGQWATDQWIAYPVVVTFSIVATPAP
jgi:polyisoprenoid-binding protein YceI